MKLKRNTILDMHCISVNQELIKKYIKNIYIKQILGSTLSCSTYFQAISTRYIIWYNYYKFECNKVIELIKQ